MVLKSKPRILSSSRCLWNSNFSLSSLILSSCRAKALFHLSSSTLSYFQLLSSFPLDSPQLPWSSIVIASISPSYYRQVLQMVLHEHHHQEGHLGQLQVQLMLEKNFSLSFVSYWLFFALPISSRLSIHLGFVLHYFLAMQVLKLPILRIIDLEHCTCICDL
jgi:hypothetical protein